MRLVFRIVLGILTYAFCIVGGAYIGFLLASFGGAWSHSSHYFWILLGAIFGAFVAWSGKAFQFTCPAAQPPAEHRTQQFNGFVRFGASAILIAGGLLALYTIAAIYSRYEVVQQRRARHERFLKAMEKHRSEPNAAFPERKSP